MEFTLNGQPVTVDVRVDESLLEVLRDRLGVRSTKDGCAPEGSCGACTVLVDGHASVSCAQKATRLAGKHVVTQEGLDEETRRLWASCFSAVGASQCGFCSPGIVLKGESLLSSHPAPTREEIAHALLGNLCRARATPRSSTPSGWQPSPSAAHRCRRPSTRGGSALARRGISATSSRSVTVRSSATWSCRRCSRAR